MRVHIHKFDEFHNNPSGKTSDSNFTQFPGGNLIKNYNPDLVRFRFKFARSRMEILVLVTI